MGRLNSIDVMRTIAIAFMVLCHFPVFLSSPVEQPWAHFFGNHVVGDFAAPFFLFLAGVSQAISLRRQRQLETRFFSEAAKRGIARGALIFLIGILFSLLVRGPDALFEWDVLTLIGASIVVIQLLRNQSAWLLVLLSVLIFFAAPWLRSQVGYLESWGGSLEPTAGFSEIFHGLLWDPSKEYSPGTGVVSTLTGFFVNGYFPIFPWLIFPLVGFALGKSIQGHSIGYYRNLCAFGVLLAAGAVGVAYQGSLEHEPILGAVTGYRSALSFYPDSSMMLLLQLGFCFVFFSILRMAADLRGGAAWNISVCQRFSKFSLTIYVLHHIVIYWPMWIAGWAYGSISMFYAQAMGAGVALALGALMLLALHFITKAWDAAGGVYSIEWLVSRIIR